VARKSVSNEVQLSGVSHIPVDLRKTDRSFSVDEAQRLSENRIFMDRKYSPASMLEQR
jgi:hypothetical protein